MTHVITVGGQIAPEIDLRVLIAVPFRGIARNRIATAFESDVAVRKEQVRDRISRAVINLAGDVGTRDRTGAVIDAAQDIGEMNIVDAPEFIDIAIRMSRLLTEENEK